ncbi:hypothetical protein JEQ12_007323 [Ovis aries]|uniref:Uncharacterized protein n=1 Tax=Ovis aries TaxID=9940 RepID=A0A835ZZT3_SHEEP|nr:hypothetical protein JEQ12_007323 [Ovis aries]
MKSKMAAAATMQSGGVLTLSLLSEKTQESSRTDQTPETGIHSPISTTHAQYSKPPSQEHEFFTDIGNHLKGDGRPPSQKLRGCQCHPGTIHSSLHGPGKTTEFPSTLITPLPEEKQ